MISLQSIGWINIDIISQDYNFLAYVKNIPEHIDSER